MKHIEKLEPTQLFSRIHEAIFELESLNSRSENIKITTSFITKRLFEELMRDYYKYDIVNVYGSKIFGVEISFNHFSNDIVIYDETRACFDEKFKVTISFS
jgi:hypothetical protein